MTTSKTLKTQKPEWAQSRGPEGEIFLDLRRFLRHGIEPLPEVEGLLREMRPCQVLRLATKTEPTHLYGLLEPKGFEHYAEQEGKHWNVFFRNCRLERKGKKRPQGGE